MGEYRLDQITVGDRVRFKHSDDEYRVAHVGKKYFHVELPSGDVSGPYWAEIVDEVFRP